MFKFSIQLAQLLVATALAYSSYVILVEPNGAIALASEFNYPVWFVFLVGILEALAALLLLVGYVKKHFVPFAGMLAVVIFTGFTLSEVFEPTPAPELILPPLTLAVLSFVVLGYYKQ